MGSKAMREATKRLCDDVVALRSENGRYRSAITEAVAILNSGTDYERMHVAGILEAAIRPVAETTHAERRLPEGVVTGPPDDEIAEEPPPKWVPASPGREWFEADQARKQAASTVAPPHEPIVTQRALTVILSPDNGGERADGCLARIDDGQEIVTAPTPMFFHRLRRRVAEKPDLAKKIQVLYVTPQKVQEIGLRAEDELRWPEGFEQELWVEENAIKELRSPSPAPVQAEPPKCPNCGSDKVAPTAGNSVGNTMDCLVCYTDFTPRATPSEIAALRSAPRFTQEDVDFLAQCERDETNGVHGFTNEYAAAKFRDLADRISQHLEGQK